jgi:hypothetical protein
MRPPIELESPPVVLHRPRLLPALAALVCLVGCGPPKAVTPGHYALNPTANCLKKSGLEVAVNPSNLDFISKTAPQGALRSARDGKAFVIAFGNTEGDANLLVAGYRRSASNKLERRRLKSLLDLEGNAVVYWHEEPSVSQATAVRSCLKG